jgi:hypothetical protein
VDTLTSAPVADVLARLFDEAKATDGPLDKRFAEVASDDKALAEFLALEAKDYKSRRAVGRLPDLCAQPRRRLSHHPCSLRRTPRQRNVSSHRLIRSSKCQRS